MGVPKHEGGGRVDCLCASFFLPGGDSLRIPLLLLTASSPQVSRIAYRLFSPSQAPSNSNLLTPAGKSRQGRPPKPTN